VYTPKDGKAPTVMDVYDFKGKGVAMSMYNTDEVCYEIVVYRWQCV
jgi:isocitrate dehydrogenase